jgi:hypothetical protein
VEETQYTSETCTFKIVLTIIEKQSSSSSYLLIWYIELAALKQWEITQREQPKRSIGKNRFGVKFMYLLCSLIFNKDFKGRRKERIVLS